MNLNRWHRWSRVSLLVAFLVCLAALFCGCQTSPVVGSVNVYKSNAADAPLIGTVRYDTNKVIAWGQAHASAEVWTKGSGFPLLMPFTWDANEVVFHQIKPKYDWHGKVGDPLPALSRDLFRDAEVVLYGLVFEPSAGTTP